MFCQSAREGKCFVMGGCDGEKRCWTQRRGVVKQRWKSGRLPANVPWPTRLCFSAFVTIQGLFLFIGDYNPDQGHLESQFMSLIHGQKNASDPISIANLRCALSRSAEVCHDCW
mmetsp:Transcript_9765/g.22507  ORF Transcript_9765/g.22507 Transcript_9765/m.22507 type:complete len:114 (-) Transcript_9765:9-350(-)